MVRALVIEADAANRLSLGGFLHSDWFDDFDSLPPGITRTVHENIVYLVGEGATPHSRLLVIPCGPHGLFGALAPNLRLECFYRVLRAALSQFRPGFVKLPLEWRIFHSGSLVSFQANRFHSRSGARVYVDMAPEGTKHVYPFQLSNNDKEPLTRAAYDADLFVDAVLSYEAALAKRSIPAGGSDRDLGHVTIALSQTFTDANITLGIPFRIWRDVKLTRQQLDFFDVPFDGPLRVKGPAGSGKTLVLAMRFLKEVYAGLDRGATVRACFLAHGEETAEHILNYLMQIDERGLFLDPSRYPGADLEITTLHGLANRYINRDTDNIQPLALDGSEGRLLQFQIVQSIVATFVRDDWAPDYKTDCRPEFVDGIEAPEAQPRHRAFCYDLSDEFANVLETFGVRGVDEIGTRYLRARAGERSLARNAAEKQTVLELYRRFRQELTEMGVVSLDQFTADFLAYLNSFRWEALRRERGFDFVFADELHLFNAQERRVLGLLLRDGESPRRVAVAYDPRQSPRNSFFPEATTERDTVWTEARLDSNRRPFELIDVFRYTPQILAFLDRLNQQFPATDLAEDWALKFGRSEVASGPVPIATESPTQLAMMQVVAERARSLVKRAGQGEQVAVLCLDHERFTQYRVASLFEKDFVVVGGRDELGMIGRFRNRAVLSMPEYVAGLQFKAILLVDCNADLVAELGGGVNGLHRFISAIYLGASRAKHQLELYSDRAVGGFAGPIRDAIEHKLVAVS